MVGETLVISSVDGNIYVRDPATGGKIREFSLGEPVFAPIVVDENILYIHSTEQILYALNTETGELRVVCSFNTK